MDKQKETELEKHEKQEVVHEDGAERITDRPVFRPRADIYETEKAIHIVANLPGVDESSVDITLEKNVLEIYGRVVPQAPDDTTLAYTEYTVGDFERSFVLSDEIDRDGIEASVKDGVLNLTLPKHKGVQTRKIKVAAAD